MLTFLMQLCMYVLTKIYCFMLTHKKYENLYDSDCESYREGTQTQYF